VESLGAGYACVTTQLPPPSSQTLRLANVTPTRLRGLIQPIPSALEAILRWNEQNGIGVLRLTSNVNPLRCARARRPGSLAPSARSPVGNTRGRPALYIVCPYFVQLRRGAA